MMVKLKTALRKDGVLFALDLYEAEGILDWIRGALAVPVHAMLKIIKTGRLRENKEIQAAWAEHGTRDTYLPVSAVRRICKEMLPGAAVKKHLLWRYSLVWHKKA